MFYFNEDTGDFAGAYFEAITQGYEILTVRRATWLGVAARWCLLGCGDKDAKGWGVVSVVFTLCLWWFASVDAMGWVPESPSHPALAFSPPHDSATGCR